MPRPLSLALVLAVSLAACGERKEAPAAGEKPPVILISVDTLRADHLPMFGYRQVETPNLDALRSDGILFTEAWAQVPLTLPSHASLMTGLLPQHAGVRNNIGYQLRAGIPTLATILRAGGYATEAAVSAYVLRGSTGISAGFDTYDDAVASAPGVAYGALQRPGSATLDAALRLVDANVSKPFFLFFHLFEPHTPYEPPEPYRTRYPSAYDGEIAAADAYLGTLVAELKARGLYDRALIVFFSDHGEGLSQHGEPEHGIFLYRETTRVPLLVKLPGNERAGESVPTPVALVDVLPTVAAVTGTPLPARVDGVSLLGKLDPARTIYGETLYPRIHLGASELRSLAGSRYHYIEAPRAELYDIQRDPAERQNVVAEERRTRAAMKDALAGYGAGIELPSRIDPEEARKLAALGYLGGTQAAADGPLPDPKDRVGEVAALSQANALLRSGKDGAAIAALREIVAKNPRFSDAWNQLALTLEKNGRVEEAAQAYSDAVKHTPELADEFALPLGTLLLRLGRLDAAEAHARLAEARQPGRAQLLEALVALARRDPATAEAKARAARSDPAAFVEASALLAGIVAERGDTPGALAMLDEAAEAARASHTAAPALDAMRAGILRRSRAAAGGAAAPHR